LNRNPASAGFFVFSTPPILVGAELAREEAVSVTPQLADTPLVGAAEGCDLLILAIDQKQDQKIAAFGSSYKDRM
jgi:hypothetical protein